MKFNLSLISIACLPFLSSPCLASNIEEDEELRLAMQLSLNDVPSQDDILKAMQEDKEQEDIKKALAESLASPATIPLSQPSEVIIPGSGLKNLQAEFNRFKVLKEKQDLERALALSTQEHQPEAPVTAHTKTNGRSAEEIQAQRLREIEEEQLLRALRMSMSSTSVVSSPSVPEEKSVPLSETEAKLKEERKLKAAQDRAYELSLYQDRAKKEISELEASIERDQKALTGHKNLEGELSSTLENDTARAQQNPDNLRLRSAVAATERALEEVRQKIAALEPSLVSYNERLAELRKILYPDNNT